MNCHPPTTLHAMPPDPDGILRLQTKSHVAQMQHCTESASCQSPNATALPRPCSNNVRRTATTTNTARQQQHVIHERKTGDSATATRECPVVCAKRRRTRFLCSDSARESATERTLDREYRGSLGRRKLIARHARAREAPP